MELLFLDTETGGLNPGVNSLLEVGLVAYRNGKIIKTKEFTLKEESYNVSPFAMKVNGLDLYEDIYKTGITKDQAVKFIISFCQLNFTEKPILVGHNPSIDKYMIRDLFNSQRYEMDNFISHRMIDTMSLLWVLHIAGKLPLEACSSNGAFKYFGIEVVNRHRALDDAIATVKLYEKLIELMKI